MQIMTTSQENMDTADKNSTKLDENTDFEPGEGKQRTDERQVQSPTVKRASRAFEEEYIQWETKVNKEFIDFLSHIRDFVTQKEGQLKEYQIDLCHRERSIQSNEDYFKDRTATLKKAEEEFQQKVERLNLQIQDRMQRLRAYEAQKHRFSASYTDSGTQTEPTDSTAAVRMHTIAHPSVYPHTHSARPEGDYVYMGAVDQTPAVSRHLGLPHSTTAQAQSPNEPVTVETGMVNDSGFNTPDPDEVSPSYRFAPNAHRGDNHQTGTKHARLHSAESHHAQTPAVNTNSDLLNAHAPGSRTSTASLGYNGERAILVKSPNGVEAYTTRAHEYRSAVTTRSRSVPPEEQKPRGRSLSPNGTRSRSMPRESDDTKSFNGVHATFSDNVIDRPASFAEGQKSPHSERSRSGSFGARSVNGHISRRAAIHNKKLLVAKGGQRTGRFVNNAHDLEGSHTRSLSLGNEPIQHLPTEDELPNSVPDYIPSSTPSTDTPQFGSSSVTNLDDPRLRESIMSKSKQASSFNMSDAIARYKAKSENHLHKDLSTSEKEISYSNGAPHWDSDSGFGYKVGSYNQNAPTTAAQPNSPDGSNFDVGLPSRSRIPGRRSEPFDLRPRHPKLTSYTHSDSNILNGANDDITIQEDISRNILPAHHEYEAKTRVTSPKPILKNPLKPYTDASYHNTYQTNASSVGYVPSRLQSPSTKSYRRYDAPPPIRRYPSEAEGNKDRVSIKSSTSDLAHNAHHGGAYHADSSSSHGSTAHSHTRTSRTSSESPEMTSTPRDPPENVDNNLHTVTESGREEYITKSNTDNDFVSNREYKPMRTFGAGSQPRTNTGHSQMPYREGTLQHPIMAGKISLRDKSTWAIKKRRELNKPIEADNNERNTTIDRPSRRLLPPGSFQRTTHKESRPKSAHISNARSRELPYEPETTANNSQAITRPTYNPHGPHETSPSVRRRGGDVYANRRSHSSEGYLEASSRSNQDPDAQLVELGYKNGIVPPPYNQSKSPPSYSNHRRHGNGVNHTQAPPTHSPSMPHYYNNNEVLERCSDSDSELYATKKETKKKSSIKSKLRGLYKGKEAKGKGIESERKNSAPQIKTEKHTSSFGYQGNAVTKERVNLSPESKRTLPTYNSYTRNVTNK